MKDSLTAEQSYESWDQTPQEVIDAARLLLEWAGPMKAWSVMGIGVSDHGELQERLSQQLAINCNLRTDRFILRDALERVVSIIEGYPADRTAYDLAREALRKVSS